MAWRSRIRQTQIARYRDRQRVERPIRHPQFRLISRINGFCQMGCRRRPNPCQRIAWTAGNHGARMPTPSPVLASPVREQRHQTLRELIFCHQRALRPVRKHHVQHAQRASAHRNANTQRVPMWIRLHVIPVHHHHRMRAGQQPTSHRGVHMFTRGAHRALARQVIWCLHWRAHALRTEPSMSQIDRGLMTTTDPASTTCNNTRPRSACVGCNASPRHFCNTAAARKVWSPPAS